MMTKKKLILAVLTGPFSLAACTQATPRSSDYFAEHLEEARQVVAGCRDGTVRGDECANANMAVEEADAKERFKIGRASCRERVCQYVEISVVAVSIKKQNTH